MTKKTYIDMDLHVLEIKKIYQRIVNYINLSVLKLEKRYLHQNGVINLYNSF